RSAVSAILPRLQNAIDSRHRKAAESRVRQTLSHFTRRVPPMFIRVTTSKLPSTAGILGVLSVGLVLIPLLSSQAQEGRKEPAATMEEVRFKGKPASFWIKKLQDKDPAERKEAVEAMGAIGPDAKAAVPALIEALEDDNTA